jgi:hypothetical protein
VDRVLLKVKWIHPDRALTQEIKQIFSNGVYLRGTGSPTEPAHPSRATHFEYSLRGAGLWHLACALYFSGNPAALPFLTLDEAQAQAARRLGFRVLPEDWTVEPSLSESPAHYKARPTSKKLLKKKPQPLKGR